MAPPIVHGPGWLKSSGYKILSKSGHTKIHLFVPSPIIEL
jgi:hypothetical protein